MHPRLHENSSDIHVPMGSCSLRNSLIVFNLKDSRRMR